MTTHSLAEMPRIDLPHGQVAIGAHASRNGHVVIAGGERFWGVSDKITIGGLLITGACFLLLLLAIAMGITSFHAQFAYIFATKHERLPSMLEALGLDCGAVIFSLLGISLAHLGRRAAVERILVVACALGSCGMNALNANLGSPRSVAVWALPPVLFALTSDRLVALIRRAALGRLADDESQRSSWRLAGTAVLYLLRFIVAPPSTAKGARQALLNATPLPVAIDSPAQLQGAAPVALTASPHRDLTAPVPSKAQSLAMAAAKRARPSGPTKAEQLLAKAASRHDLDTMPLDRVSSLAAEIAGEIDLHPGTARRVLLNHVRQIQSGGAP